MSRTRQTFALLTAPLVWLFVYAGVWIAGQFAGIFGLKAAMNGRWQDVAVALFASLPVLGCLWLWLHFYERRRLSDIGLAGPARRDLLRGFFMGCLLVAGVAAAGMLLGVYSFAGPGAWQGADMVWLMAAVLVIAGTFVQATVTEALWRGWMLQTVATQWGAIPALIFNVVAGLVIQGGGLFQSPEHLLGGINLALMAGFLSLKALRDGSLWGVCGVHTGWNLMMGLGLGLNIDGGQTGVTPLLFRLTPNGDAPSPMHGGWFGPDASLLMTVAAVAAIAWTLRRPGRPQAPRRDSDPDAVYDHH
ncbi:CPBP family intramembrane glutamic endopeptidase [Asticcacaulis sp. AC402]|uniref:CPBP family intramembrane glutamic endopeptidase n=1 Tax=Asticcacaulis sp. AC402 TaxID=1282361 RepID=UPI0003C3EA36|nr:CPBP family intramembrane glutamic endopeptidase [Asticcacaulis sp. AC402]ESQ75217.1 hypothetical protein ABAC402_11145 [Asticcacaulis sp. AC402]